MIEGKDYYVENDRYVFTKEFLLKRGRCCSSGCRNCPYGDTMDILTKAQQIATQAHEGQKRWNGEPYITHPCRVANALNTSRLKSIAWVHDVVEDTEVPLSHIRNSLSEEIAVAVDHLTKRKDESYKDFILRVSRNIDATLVKIEDIKDNLRDLKNGSRRDKYELALVILERSIHDD